MDTSPETNRKTTGQIATARWMRALRNPDAKLRRSAAEALGNKMPTDEIIVAALLESMHDPHEEVRAAAVSALGAIGSVGAKTQEVIAALLEASRDSCKQVSEIAEKAFLTVLENIPDIWGD